MSGSDVGNENGERAGGGSKGVTRRQLLNTAGGAAAGGLVLGGAGGFLTGRAGASNDQASSSGKSLTIGALIPVTGPGAADGQEEQNGMRLAADEINAAGGIHGRKIRFSVLDAKDGAPNIMTNAMRKFVSDGAAAIITPGLTTANVEVPIIGQAKIPLMHINTYQGNVDFAVEKGYRNIFQMDPSETWYGPGFSAVMESLTEKGLFTPRDRTAAIVAAKDDYSFKIANSFKDEIEASGWKVVQFDTYVSPQVEWGGVLSRIRGKNPDVIFQSDSISGNEASFIKQFAEAPTRSLVYQQYAPSVPDYRKLSGAASDGVLWSTVTGTILSDDVGKAFEKKYQEKYNTEPGRSTAGAMYDCVWFWAQAAAMAKDPYDFDSVNDNMDRLIYRGVNGAYNLVGQTCLPFPAKFDDPSLGMPLQTYQIQDGEQVLISPEPYATGKFKVPAWLK